MHRLTSERGGAGGGRIGRVLMVKREQCEPRGSQSSPVGKQIVRRTQTRLQTMHTFAAMNKTGTEADCTNIDSINFDSMNFHEFRQSCLDILAGDMPSVCIGTFPTFANHHGTREGRHRRRRRRDGWRVSRALVTRRAIGREPVT